MATNEKQQGCENTDTKVSLDHKWYVQKGLKRRQTETTSIKVNQYAYI